MSLVKFFFRTFQQNYKSAKLGPHSASELSADFTSSTPPAHVDHWVDRDDVCTGPYGRGWCQTTSRGTRRGTSLTAARWLRGFWCGSSLVAERQEWFWLAPSFLIYPLTLPASSRCLHVEIWTFPASSYLSVLLVFGCCLWSTSYWIFRGRVHCLVQQWIHVLREALVEFQHFLRCGELES